MADYDTIFIGSGHATWHAAVTLAQAQQNVAIIEEDTIAGTCTNFGCDAKILLDGPFELTEQLKQYQGIGVNTSPTIDWAQLMAYKQQIIQPLAMQMTAIFKQLGITIITGHGELTDTHTVQVDTTKYTADNIVIGTGQRPAKLAIPGADLMHDSRDFLDLPTMPKRLTLIGAGIISLEFANMAVLLGSEVHIIEFADRALPAFYSKHVEKIMAHLQAAGVHFHFGEALSRVTQTATGLLATTKSGLSIVSDDIIAATGRIPNIEHLGLTTVGIETDRHGIIVDDHLRTTVSNIYASGDVISKRLPKLTPTATFESNYIAAQLLGNTAAIDYPVIPSVVFTLPRIAQVGISVETAKSDTEHFHVQELPYGKLLAFQYQNEVDADLQLVFDRANYLVGAAIYGNGAPDLINLLTLLITDHVSANELSHKIFAFPSASVGIIDMLTPLLHHDR
ncbi:dihydrolipoyl dehydrogenase family protein [Lactiplantibacillus paraplantarum]|uniref:dihydrolipoyl dehydrogenase family protein n=1 Tax=Lactiplantibacillus paraplantarum TaxID=60520 RepID=UPI0023AAF2E1|nr:NAD(P)/FAD-dependent oxidoreductase [Lactiplantibacillus paraplantarum]WEE34597.1 NAD(P)/FAD-dependent oxidoreductase [Lactiplantibacillus paraplantarum]